MSIKLSGWLVGELVRFVNYSMAAMEEVQRAALDQPRLESIRCAARLGYAMQPLSGILTNKYVFLKYNLDYLQRVLPLSSVSTPL